MSDADISNSTEEQARKEIERIQNIDQNDIYDILKVSESASKKEIEKAYRKITLLIHPDKCNLDGATDATQKINRARDDAFLNIENPKGFEDSSSNKQQKYQRDYTDSNTSYNSRGNDSDSFQELYYNPWSWKNYSTYSYSWFENSTYKSYKENRYKAGIQELDQINEKNYPICFFLCGLSLILCFLIYKFIQKQRIN